MTKLFISVVVILMHLSVSAEYNGYQFKLELEDTNGQVETGYVYLVAAYFDLDSADNTDYLKKQLKVPNASTTTHLGYFKNRMVYQAIHPEYPDDAFSHYELLNFVSVPRTDIVKIKIVETKDYSYLSSISSGLTLADSTWVNKKCDSYFSTGGYLCDYQIYIHEDHPEIQKIKTELDAKLKEWEGVEIDYDNGDQLDAEVDEIVGKLNDYRVVVIKTCTC